MNISCTKLVGVALVISAITVWLYWPSTRGDFLDVDDKDYLQRAVEWNGLTWGAAKESFTMVKPYYQPLPRLSHVLDYQLWGKNAAGHHATSVFVHALNAALVFGFIWTLLGAVSLTIGERLAMACGIAVVFAIHPLQAESVAWMSGRTQLLCATFGIGCVWAYAANARRWVAWGLYVAALLCKPIAVSLPFVMLAMDYFPLRRHEQLGWGRLFREKAALIGLAVAAGVATTMTEADLVPWEEASPWQRVLTTFQSLMFYPWRLVGPGHLSPLYPLHVVPSLGQWWVIVSVLSVGVITTLALRGWRRWPALAAGWGAYVAFVLPVSGLTHGLGAVAPRHAYMAMLPLLLLAGGATAWGWRRLTVVARLVLVGLFACELCVFGAGVRSLIPDWHDEETLRRAVLAQFPDSEYDNRVLAQVLLKQGRDSEALVYAERAVQISPQVCWARVALGDALYRLGRLPEAVEQYEQALRIQPDISEARYNLGMIFEQTGRTQEAIMEFEEALRIRPEDAKVHNNLGVVLQLTGKIQEAIGQYEQALRIKPDYAKAHYNLGVAFEEVGRMPEAIQEFEITLRVQPDHTTAHYYLGVILEKQRHTPEAIEQYEQELKLQPDFAPARDAVARLKAQAPPRQQN